MASDLPESQRITDGELADNIPIFVSLSSSL